MRHPIVFFFSLSVLSFVCSGYQYESFEWNDTREETEQDVLVRENHIVFADEEHIVYQDKKYRHPCTVTLSFDSEDRLLEKVSVKWDTTEVGPRVRQVLTGKYGKPYSRSAYGQSYLWRDPQRDEVVRLNYSVRSTELTYFGKKFYQKHRGPDKGWKGTAW
ncbi:MAG: hypothetical protein GF333_03870 [Candidatus Omnitrophica bacterium]|nr:hypothetical protein [Candidatus Omnitrophota bacterium]